MGLRFCDIVMLIVMKLFFTLTLMGVFNWYVPMVPVLMTMLCNQMFDIIVILVVWIPDSLEGLFDLTHLTLMFKQAPPLFAV